MTARGKFVLTILILAVVGFGVYRWWDKIAPQSKSQNVSVDTAKMKKELARGQAAAAADITSKLLAGDKAVSLVDGSAIPPVSGVSDYDKTMKDGKLVVQFPINIWPGWAPIIVANNGLEPNDESMFFKKYGFYVKLCHRGRSGQGARPVRQRPQPRPLGHARHDGAVRAGAGQGLAHRAGHLPADRLVGGGDGIVARGDIRNINDFRMKDGKRRKVVLAQNSPSHYLIMSLLIDAGIDPGEVDFKWAADAPAAAKIFVQDPSFDAFVGWSPDIYTVTDKVPGTRLVVTTGSANHLIADVWAVRNDFYRDHPDIVANLVRGIFEGMDMVRKDVAGAAQTLSKAYSIPVEDCTGHDRQGRRRWPRATRT